MIFVFLQFYQAQPHHNLFSFNFSVQEFILIRKQQKQIEIKKKHPPGPFHVSHLLEEIYSSFINYHSRGVVPGSGKKQGKDFIGRVRKTFTAA